MVSYLGLIVKGLWFFIWMLSGFLMFYFFIKGMYPGAVTAAWAHGAGAFWVYDLIMSK